MFVLLAQLLYQSIATAVAAPTGVFAGLIQQYGYSAVFVLMLLEGIGFPVPSEVVIPLAGYYAASGLLSPSLAFVAVFTGTTGGLLIDYHVGFALGRKTVYNRLRAFHVNKRRLDSLDRWFKSHGTFAVFIVRFIPEIRALISVPAGFAKMPFNKFIAASLAGTFIWDLVLMRLGENLEFVSNTYTALIGIGVFGVVIYAMYYYGIKWMHERPKGGHERK